MGWFDDIINEAANPAGYIVGQLAGGDAKSKWNDVTGVNKANEFLFGKSQDEIDAQNAAEQQQVKAQLGTDQQNFNSWENLAQNLEAGKFATDKQGLAADSSSNLANATNNLAMRGGLSTGANERLAEANMNGFQDAYSNMATKYGLGAADISKSRYEKQADLEQARLIGADKAAAIRQAGKGGLLSGLFGS